MYYSTCIELIFYYFFRFYSLYVWKEIRKKDVKNYVKVFFFPQVSWQIRWLFLDYDVGRLVGLEDFVVVTQNTQWVFGMWVWCGGAPWTWPKARKHIFVFFKCKNSPRKNCNQLHAIFKKVSHVKLIFWY